MRWLLLLIAVPALAQRPPIIDMHLHADPADSNGPPPVAICPGGEFPPHDPRRPWLETFGRHATNPPCANAIWGPKTDEGVRTETIAILERRNIYGVASGPLLDEWTKSSSRIIPSLGFTFSPAPVPAPEQVRELLTAGKYRVFGEVAIQYEGVAPDDPRFDPYAAAAEAADVPMAIHIGTGPPGAPYMPGWPNYRARLHSPLLLEEVLVRHPKLRVSIMHAGWPMLDDLLAVLWAHPQVYVDTGAISWALPRKEFHRYLQRIVEAGFGKRVMFGSDQMNWPKAIEYAIESIESAPFLSAEQKRDIFYKNAARFLRLSDGEMARHRGR